MIMVTSPSSLFNIILDFLAQNVPEIDSLCGFPSTVGQLIFERIVEKKYFLCEDVQRRTSMASKFSKAYPDLVLVALSLSNQLLIINEFLEPLMKFTEWIVELDLSFNHLGDNHEFMNHICCLKSLKILSLKENLLSDHAVRKMTLPVEMFNQGMLNLQEVDLSDNLVTDAIIPWLARLPNLKFIDLTRTLLTDKGFHLLRTENGMLPCNRSEWSKTEIITQGWANNVIDQWKDFCFKARAQKKVKVPSAFYSRDVKVQSSSYQGRNSVSQIWCFVKKPYIKSSIKRHSGAVCERECQMSTNTSKRFKAIEDEIFTQYA